MHLAWVHERRWDVLLSTLAIAIQLPTAWYRYGIDQGLYHYFGAGWLEGRLPYRDAFDVKPPAVYALYALAIRLLGPAQSSIRLFEIAAVIGTGWMVARAARQAAPRVDGVAGACAVLFASWYSSLWGFWDTAQVELWEGGFVVSAYAVLASGPATASRLVTAGLLSGVAISFKLPAAFAAALLALVAGIAAVRAPSSLPRVGRFALGIARFGAGASLPVFATLLYFAAHGSVSQLVEWFRYLPHYAATPLDEAWVTTLGPETLVARGPSWYGVIGGLWLVGISEAHRDGDSARVRGAVISLLLLALAALGVIAQRRYLSYHGVVLGPFLALAGAWGVHEAMRRRRELTAGVVLCAAGASFLGAEPWIANPSMSYRTFVWHSWLPYLIGRRSRTELDAAFTGPFDYSYAVQTSLGRLILQQGPARGDGLHVRGFDTLPYVLTGLHSPSRFMIEVPLTNSYLLQFRPAWALEHAAALAQRPPRFFVTTVGQMLDLEQLRAGGYGMVGSRGRFVLLERAYDSVPLSAETLSGLLPGSTVSGSVIGTIPFESHLDAREGIEGRVGAERDLGKWRISSRGEVCIRWSRWLDGTERCAVLYAHGARYQAFEASGLELGNLEIRRGPGG